jgi:hypothetical protein
VRSAGLGAGGEEGVQGKKSGREEMIGGEDLGDVS